MPERPVSSNGLRHGIIECNQCGCYVHRKGIAGHFGFTESQARASSLTCVIPPLPYPLVRKSLLRNHVGRRAKMIPRMEGLKGSGKNDVRLSWRRLTSTTSQQPARVELPRLVDGLHEPKKNGVTVWLSSSWRMASPSTRCRQPSSAEYSRLLRPHFHQ